MLAVQSKQYRTKRRLWCRRSIGISMAAVASLLLTEAPSVGETRTDSDGSRYEEPASAGAEPSFSGDQQQRAEQYFAHQAAIGRSPEHKRKRSQSASAYRSQRREEALATLRAHFAELAAAPPWTPLRLGDGDELKSYLGIYAAKVATKDDGTVLVQSQMPMRTNVNGGRLSPVSYKLEDKGEEFRLANPIVPTVIPKKLDRGIAFPQQDFTIRPSGASSTDPPMVLGEKVLFANLVTDTDLLVVPSPTGVETLLQVRSAEAPESSALQLGLAAGQSLDPVTDGSPGSLDLIAVRILASDGQQIAEIPAPSAFDAEGRPVAVTLSIQGPNKIVVSYPHRGQDVAYPLLIDPVVDNYAIDPYTGGRANDYDPFYYWDYWGNGYYDHTVRKNPTDPYAFASLRGQGGWGNGLYVYAPQTGWFFWGGTIGEWIWPAPANSFITRADFGYVTHSPYNTCVVEGVFNAGAGTWNAGTWQHPPGQPTPSGPSPWYGYAGPDNANACASLSNNYKAHYISSPTPGNEMVFGMLASGDGYRGQPIAYLYGASMWLDDADTPTLGAPQHSYTLAGQSCCTAGLPSGWVDTASFGVKADAGDAGLGVKKIDLVIDGTYRSSSTNPCSGGKDYRCPNYWPASAQGSQNYTTDSFSEGTHNAYLVATDVIDHPSADSATWQFKIDRSPPTITSLSGSLFDHRNRTNDHREEGLYDTDYGLRGAATDQYSGVQSIEVLVGGTSQRERGGYSTSGTLDWTLHPDDYADGDTNVTVLVRDRVASASAACGDRHVSCQTFSITIARRGSIVHAYEYSGDPASGGTLEGNEWAVPHATSPARREGASYIQTRDAIRCVDGSQECGACSEASTCDEVRTRSLDSASGDPADKDSFAVEASRTEGDPRLPQIADILDPHLYGERAPDRTGPINDAVAAWQTLPPAHGDSYAYYETTDDSAASEDDDVSTGADGEESTSDVQQAIGSRVWVDQKTNFPLHEQALDESGAVLDEVYFSYSKVRTVRGQHADDFFRVADPGVGDSDYHSDDQLIGKDAAGTQRDRSTGADFQPYFLGGSLPLAGETLCLATGSIAHDHEGPGTIPSPSSDTGDGTQPLESFSTVSFEYNFVDPSACTPGITGTLDQPDLEITSFAQGSAQAQDLREQFQDEGTAIQMDSQSPWFTSDGVQPVNYGLTPVVAYVVPADQGDHAALMDIGGSTVQIIGPFDRQILQDLVNKLQAR